MKISNTLINIILLAMFSSCASWVESAKKLIDKDETTQKRKQVKWVSKAQYDDLLVKYNNLNQENQKLKVVQSDMSSNSQTGYNQVDEMSKSDEASEAIDVFASEQLAKELSKAKTPSSKSHSNKDISSLVSSYNKAITLKRNGKLKIALGIFQSLERSGVEQVVVRARYQIAEIYYNQNQFDLSLQVYESIISNNSYSAVVLDALKGAMLSSKSLGLTEKQMRYQSVLKDFFGINS